MPADGNEVGRIVAGIGVGCVSSTVGDLTHPFESAEKPIGSDVYQ